jgi:hypothetical protein
MTTFFRNHFEKLLLAAALLLLLADAAWAWAERPRVAPRRWQVAAEMTPGTRYEGITFAGRDEPLAAWSEPAAQSSGAEWRYEVFTPPVIYYNAVAKTFCVTAPDATGPADPGEDAAFDVELLTVKREAFRLQLAGCYGAPGAYTGVFVSPRAPATRFARAGERLAELGLQVRDLTVMKVPVAHRDRWPVYDAIATAVLHDERDGTEVTLDTRTRKFTDSGLAVLRLGNTTAEVRAGDTVEGAGALYRVERIRLDPPEVEVARLGPDRSPAETRLLCPNGGGGQLAGQDDGMDDETSGPIKTAVVWVEPAK